MEKELPSTGYAEESRREIPPPFDENRKKRKSKNRSNIEARHTEAEIMALADKVSEILNKMAKIPEFLSMSYTLRRDRAIRSCLEIPRFKKLSDEEKAVKQLIMKELSSRGAKVTNKKKEIKKMNTVPKRKVFTPAQIKSMIEQSQELQVKDEKRAGQTWEDSDI